MTSLDLMGGILGETLPWWLPTGLLTFGSVKSRRVWARLFCGAILLPWLFLTLAGNLVVGKQDGVTLLMVLLAAIVGASLGYAGRHRTSAAVR